ncbi:hypothetical protein [Paenibacillus sp. LjRoot56]
MGEELGSDWLLETAVLGMTVAATTITERNAVLTLLAAVHRNMYNYPPQ